MGARGQREFFTVRTVSEAMSGFRPERRTPVETLSLADALGRVPAEPVTAPHALPGFARATVDGFAVRAADTYGASEGLPSYLDLIGEAQMGTPPEHEVRQGGAVAIATGAPLPPGADAVLKVEYTQSPTPELIEVLRPATPGEGMVRADEDAAPGTDLVRPGRPLRAQDLGMLAAAGIPEIRAHARPRVAIVSTGDELVAPDTPAALPVGQVRDSSAPALAALVREAGGEPAFAGIVPDDRDALATRLREALPNSDVLVVSAGSSVGARDETAAAIASLGEPGIWCHGLSLKPGKPTLLADVGGIPVIGLPGNPRSALVVFRLMGMPIVRMVAGCTEPPPEPSVRARLTRDLPSAAGRLDVVQVRLAGAGTDADEGAAAETASLPSAAASTTPASAAERDTEPPAAATASPPRAGDAELPAAEPLFGSSSLLSILTAADGYLLVPEAATGLAAGSDVEVMLYR